MGFGRPMLPAHGCAHEDFFGELDFFIFLENHALSSSGSPDELRGSPGEQNRAFYKKRQKVPRGKSGTHFDV